MNAEHKDCGSNNGDFVSLPHTPEEVARRVESFPDLLAAARALDEFWTEAFPDGPDGSRQFAGGIGELSEDTVVLWRKVRAAIACAEDSHV